MPPQYSEDHLRLRSSQILVSKTKEISVFHQDAEDEFPKFKPSEVKIGKILGKGGFCTVSEVSSVLCTLTKEEIDEEGVEKTYVGLQNKKFIKDRHIRDKVARYAIKKVTDNAFSKGDPQFFVSSIVDLAMEVKFLSVLRHSHIIKMRALADVSHCSSEFFILMDRLPDTLDRRIAEWSKKNKKSMLKKEVKEEMFYDRLSIAYDICTALVFLHQNNIIYRDLKPDNLGFDVRDDVKLFDFGLAREIHAKDRVGDSNPAIYNLTGQTGSYRYMAPEVAKERPYNQTADVYSFSILLCFMCNLEAPFEGFNHVKMMQKVFTKGVRPKISKMCPESLAEIIPRMWHTDLSNRPELDEVLEVLAQVLTAINGDDYELDNTNRTRMSFDASN